MFMISLAVNVKRLHRAHSLFNKLSREQYDTAWRQGRIVHRRGGAKDPRVRIEGDHRGTVERSLRRQ